MALVSLPRQVVIDAEGDPIVGAQLSIYDAGTNNTRVVYTTKSYSTPLVQPIASTEGGIFPAIYVNPVGGDYKLTLHTAEGVLIYSEDNIPIRDFTSADLSQILDSLKRSDAEIAAGITPTNYAYPRNDPRRYGVIGDGLTDDTAAMNVVASMTNAGQAFVFRDLNVLCGPVSTLSANDLSWTFENSQLKVRANTWSDSAHLNISGDRPRLVGLVMDGNQSAFTAEPSGWLLQLLDTVADPQLINVTLKNSPAVGLRNYSSGGTYTGCHFDDNANLGEEIIAGANGKYVSCTWDRNGYGYQTSFANNAFAAFGQAIRYRAHHICLTNCQAKQNGRDGFNVNQGSYAVTYVNCLAWMNGDGGFTMAADSEAALPGNGESCYDIEYHGCEAYNNYTSGISSYQPSHNVTVKGGRYYNNGRALGLLAITSSYTSGVYFAAGSTGISVDTKAYDDRQFRAVTAASGTSPRTVTATGWATGTATNYPRVALYNASMMFQGYGTISSDAAGSVIITSTANNGVTLANIASGWFITQRVQHNGVFFDNNAQGVIKVEGFGQLPGPLAYTGYKAISGYLANGQNVLLPDSPVGQELLSNATFDANNTGWSISVPGGGASTNDTSTHRRSPACLKLVAGSGSAVADGALITDGLLAITGSASGAFVEFSMWVETTGRADAAIVLLWTVDGNTFSSTVNHPGGGYRHLKVGAFIPSTATDVTPRVISAATKTSYYDTGSLRVRVPHTDNNDYAPSSRYLAV